MLLSEAKEILKKNGYKLVEAYDAVSDRNNIKDGRQHNQSYFTALMKRLKNGLAEEGINAKLVDAGDGLRIGHYRIRYQVSSWPSGSIGTDAWDKETAYGPESGKNANYKFMENKITLKLYFEFKQVIDTAVFDVRNTPNMVQWIIDHIK